MISYFQTRVQGLLIYSLTLGWVLVIENFLVFVHNPMLSIKLNSKIEVIPNCFGHFNLHLFRGHHIYYSFNISISVLRGLLHVTPISRLVKFLPEYFFLYLSPTSLDQSVATLYQAFLQFGINGVNVVSITHSYFDSFFFFLNQEIQISCYRCFFRIHSCLLIYLTLFRFFVMHF